MIVQLLTLASASSTCPTSCAKVGCHFFDKKCPCACNDRCEHFKDCCKDYTSTCAAPAHGGGPVGGPEQHHLSLTQEQGEMVVTFATAARFRGQTPTCAITKAGKHYNFTGSTHTYTDGGWKGLLHTVRLVGLDASSEYTYRCAIGSTFGPMLRFTSAPAPAAFPMVVAVVGDLGEGCNKPGCGNATIRRLQLDVARNGSHVPYDMLLHVGDIAYTGGDQTVRPPSRPFCVRLASQHARTLSPPSP